MAEDPSIEAAPAPAPPPSKGSKIVPLMLFLNLAATGGGTFIQLRHKPELAAPVPAAAEPEVKTTGPVAPLDAYVVNLNEPGPSRYLKATFEAELASPKAVEELEKNKRIVRDEVLRYLSGLSVADTLGTENKEKIQHEIVTRADKALGGGRVKRVFFIDFVVQ
jgi:flagellar FliL protein